MLSCSGALQLRTLLHRERTLSGARDEVRHHLRQRLAHVLLKEVTAAVERGVRAAFRSGDRALQEDVSAARDRI